MYKKLKFDELTNIIGGGNILVQVVHSQVVLQLLL
ncbi:Uncharacterised protein [Streptococcus equi subsp. zooepidemicus]|nr:hypothetical protein GDAKBCAL_00703 [Streptococcus equi subsp. zooepidemicus]QUQ79754.1 hypothetical protein LJFMMFNO_00756 [Streptococcus equi subsp. zooepidemicus]SQF05255.1 Uncharacterised protein [Streptococcus equi subsp. zooepidemicus]